MGPTHLPLWMNSFGNFPKCLFIWPEQYLTKLWASEIVLEKCPNLGLGYGKDNCPSKSNTKNCHRDQKHLLKLIFFAFSYLQAGAFQSFLSPRQTIFYKIQESPVEINMIFEGKVLLLHCWNWDILWLLWIAYSKTIKLVQSIADLFCDLPGYFAMISNLTRSNQVHQGMLYRMTSHCRQTYT